mgnify:CR=1 FL=1
MSKYRIEYKEKNIPELDDNFIDLKKAYETFEEFDHKNFLDGAEAAFEAGSRGSAL